MGQQQLLLIILGVIIVGVAVTVGISMFATQSDESVKDQIVTDLNAICSNASRYRIKGKWAGGGQGTFVGYKIPSGLDSNKHINAVYQLDGAPLDGLVKLKVTAPAIATSITAQVDSVGNITVAGRY